MPQDFDQITAAPAEDVEIAPMRITLEVLLDLQSQALHAATHVGNRHEHPTYPSRDTLAIELGVS